MQTVCLVGLGNLAHVAAGVFSQRDDVRVRALAVRPGRAEQFSDGPEVSLPPSMGGGSIRARLDRVSAEAEDVVAGADVVFLCTPSHVEPAVLARIAPFVGDAIVCAVPGPGGFHWAAQRLLPRSATICGLASIPWMSKADVFGKKARILGKKTLTGLACTEEEKADACCSVFSDLLQMPVVNIGGFLPIILNPANQLLHPAILWDLFVDDDGKPLAEAPLFYESCSARAASLLEEMSHELLAIRDALQALRPELWLGAVLPIDQAIQWAYGDDVVDARSLRSIIASNRAYAGIRTPMVEAAGGLRPNWGSRFLWEDIPYGLVVVRGLADLVGVRVPAIDRVITWAQAKMEKQYLRNGVLDGADLADSGAPARWGITRPEQLWEGP